MKIDYCSYALDQTRATRRLARRASRSTPRARLSLRPYPDSIDPPFPNLVASSLHRFSLPRLAPRSGSGGQVDPLLPPSPRPSAPPLRAPARAAGPLPLLPPSPESPRPSGLQASSRPVGGGFHPSSLSSCPPAFAAVRLAPSGASPPPASPAPPDPDPSRRSVWQRTSALRLTGSPPPRSNEMKKKYVSLFELWDKSSKARKLTSTSTPSPLSVEVESNLQLALVQTHDEAPQPKNLCELSVLWLSQERMNNIILFTNFLSWCSFFR